MIVTIHLYIRLMKTTKSLLFITLVFMGLLGCERPDVGAVDAPAQPQAAAGGNFTSLYNRNKAEILGNLDILARSMAQRITDAGLGAMVKARVEENGITGENMVSIAALKQCCAQAGTDLASQMATSLAACGGTAAQLQKLPAIADGFMVEGKLFQPSIFVPQLDRTEFTELQSWPGVLPEYVGSLATVQGNTVTVYDAQGQQHSFTEAELRSHPTWFVSVMPVEGEWDGGGGSPLRFWHMCKCKFFEGPSGGGRACRPDGDETDCGRTTFFGKNCPGSGGIFCAGQ